MAESRPSLAEQLGRLTRRQALGAVAGGGLIGSAWAAVFRDAVLAEGDARVTVARTPSALGALITHRGHRILVIHAADAAGAATVTQLAAGFMRPRIDAVLVPSTSADLLSRDFRHRWRVRGVWTLPDGPDPTSSSLAGRCLRAGRTEITTDSLPVGAWRADALPTLPWYVAVTFGRARLTIASDRSALARLPLDAGLINAVVCGDPELQLVSVPPEIQALAAPVEVLDDLPVGMRIAPLSAGTPVAFGLRDDAIEVLGMS